MDFVFEILFEIILEGCMLITEEKKIPLPLRILCAILVISFYIGFIGIFIYVAVSNQSKLLLLITIGIALLILFAFAYKYRKFRKHK